MRGPAATPARWGWLWARSVCIADSVACRREAPGGLACYVGVSGFASGVVAREFMQTCHLICRDRRMQMDHNAIHIGHRMKYAVFDLFGDSVALEHCPR